MNRRSTFSVLVIGLLAGCGGATSDTLRPAEAASPATSAAADPQPGALETLPTITTSFR